VAVASRYSSLSRIASPSIVDGPDLDIDKYNIESFSKKDLLSQLTAAAQSFDSTASLGN
jgi:hypothetical protein